MVYEIIPQDDNVMVTFTEDGKSEQISMMEVPDETLTLVQKSKKDVLEEINLNKILTNLDYCVDLLQITFNAVDGFDVQGRVQKLTKRFMDAMKESNITVLDFKLAVEQVLDVYVNAYGNFFYGEIETARMLLADMQHMAARMEKKTDALVQAFSDLTDYTKSVLEKVIDERAVDEKKRAEANTLINELQGSIDAMDALKERLRKEIKQADSEYEDLQQQKMKQEQWADNMQLASIMIGNISSIFGIVGNEEDYIDYWAVGDESKSELNQEKRAYAENIERQKQKKAQICKIDEQLAAIDRVLEFASEQQTVEQLQKEKKRKTEEKGGVSLALETLKEEEAVLGEKLRNLVAEEIKDSLAKRQSDIEKMRRQLKEQERENLAGLAKNTAKMKKMVMDENAPESAVQCLVIAIGCLRRVLAYVQEICLFWSDVKTVCGNLAENKNITNLIEMQKTKDPEQRAAYFKTILFVRGYIGVVAKWKALYVIFSEYLTEFMQMARRLMDSMEQKLSADRNKQWELAAAIAEELNKKLEKELKTLD